MEFYRHRDLSLMGTRYIPRRPGRFRSAEASLSLLLLLLEFLSSITRMSALGAKHLTVRNRNVSNRLTQIEWREYLQYYDSLAVSESPFLVSFERSNVYVSHVCHTHTHTHTQSDLLVVPPVIVAPVSRDHLVVTLMTFHGPLSARHVGGRARIQLAFCMP